MKLRILFAAIAAAASSLAAFAAPPQISFSAPRFNVTVTPGATIAYLYVAGSRNRGGGVLTDTDGNGQIAIETDLTVLPSGHGLVVIDTATGEFASSSYAPMIGLGARSIVPGPSGAFTEFFVEKEQALAMWVRPGSGVWAPASFFVDDRDGSSTNKLVMGSVTSFQRVGTSPARPAGFAHGDRFFIIGTSSSQPQGGLVDARLDDPPYAGLVTFSDFNGTSVVEGNDLVFYVLRLLGSTGTVTLKCKLNDIGGTAVAGVDYVAIDPVITLAPGEVVKRVIVPTIDDAAWANTRSVTARLTEVVPTGAVSPSNQTAGILENDPAPVLAIEGLPATTDETDAPVPVTAAITIANAGRVPVTVAYTYTGNDSTKRLVFAPSETRKELTFTLPGDDELKGDAVFRVQLELEETDQVVKHDVRIVEDELATLSIADASGQENTQITITPSFKPFLPTAAQFKWTTVDGTAKAGQDYQSASGTHTTNHSSFTIRLLGDTEAEGNETFYIDIIEVQKLAPERTRIAITIIDDDALPPPTFSNLRAVEGNDYGWRWFPATLTLPAPLPYPITYQINATDGTATRKQDYDAGNVPITFQAGQTAAEVNVAILGDDVPEGDETFTLSVAGTTATAVFTIIDDDSGVTPAMTIEDVSVTEGTGGDRTAIVRVSLSAAATHVVRVNVATTAGTATLGADYSPSFSAGTFNFAAGTTAREFSIRIMGDGIDEPDEVLFVNLSNAIGATLVRSQAKVTIVDDDAAAPDRRRSVRH